MARGPWYKSNTVQKPFCKQILFRMILLTEQLARWHRALHILVFSLPSYYQWSKQDQGSFNGNFGWEWEEQANQWHTISWGGIQFSVDFLGSHINYFFESRTIGKVFKTVKTIILSGTIIFKSRKELLLVGIHLKIYIGIGLKIFCYNS